MAPADAALSTGPVRADSTVRTGYGPLAPGDFFYQGVFATITHLTANTLMLFGAKMNWCTHVLYLECIVCYCTCCMLLYYHMVPFTAC
jgi:hypothetical protein